MLVAPPGVFQGLPTEDKRTRAVILLFCAVSLFFFCAAFDSQASAAETNGVLKSSAAVKLLVC